MFASKPELFDFRSALFLILDGYKLKSVEGFCAIAKQVWPDSGFLLDNIRLNCLLGYDYEKLKMLFEEDCNNLSADKSRVFNMLFSSVLGDFMEKVPHLHPDGTLSEEDLYFNSYNSHICEICGDEIEPGDPAFFRTDPCPAIRHRKCSRSARSSHEYAFIEYMVKEIAYHEQVFRFNECCMYRLHESPGMSLKQHRKIGYSIEYDGLVKRIPNLGEFVLDFISGVEDYDLIRKYRPYHTYLDFMLREIGFDNKTIAGLGGFKYFLREDLCHKICPEVVVRIENISLSEFMFDRYIYKLVSKEIINSIYIATFKRIFQIMGILIGENTITLNDTQQTYAINETNSGTDISIIVDNNDIFCVDFEKSLSFTDYFTDFPEEVHRLLNYCKQFGVDT